MKGNKKQRKNSKGITLIALVITIIVLLILAGVSIAMLTGENGILTQAQRAKTETENAQKEEENILANYESVLNSYSGENTEFTDSLGNKVKVPAGFKVVNPGDNVEDGIIIEDVAHGATAGSQFVWIPVGTVHRKDKEDVTIELGRYIFDSSGNVSEYSGNYTEDTVAEHTYDNTPAKDITTFISKVENTHGYYIGRYEARTLDGERTVSTEDSGLTQITVKPNDFVYNYVTQLQAAKLSRNMYNDSNFESDLINSYAWDTAIVFIQNCSNQSNYANQASVNTSVASKGTNNTDTKDVLCNVYDMASNCMEWSTETWDNIDNPCTYRGGNYPYNYKYTSNRSNLDTTHSTVNYSFRPILYL